MEAEMYLVGEPLIKVCKRDDFLSPVGQVEACRRVLRETQQSEVVEENLRKEYLAIIYALWELKIDFRIVHAHAKDVDMALLNLCTGTMGCRLMGFGPHFSPAALAYPRDFCTVLPHLLLLSNNAIKEVTAEEKAGWRLIVSPYGEGGRALPQGDTMVACERVIIKDGESVVDAGLERIRRLGIKVGMFPSVLAARFSLAQQDPKVFRSNDHIDRVACLLRGKDSKLYLVVDPKVATADWTKPQRKIPWGYHDPAETKEQLKQNMGPMGIEVLWPSSISVPYALNLLQFPDGRVLMTSGDPEVNALVSDIVGAEKVFTTEIPIRYFPVWKYAGIRCIVGDAPLPIMKLV